MFLFKNYYLFIQPLEVGMVFEIYSNISNIIKSSQTNISKTSDYLVTIHKIKIENCKAGEIYNFFLGICIECPHGTYSFDPKNQECQICPDQALNCKGNLVNLKPKFWRSPKTNIIYECFPYEESCL